LFKCFKQSHLNQIASNETKMLQTSSLHVSKSTKCFKKTKLQPISSKLNQNATNKQTQCCKHVANMLSMLQTKLVRCCKHFQALNFKVS
jgi:hypothetical protein